MKINRDVIIEGKTFDNSFYVSLDFDQNFLPILKMKRFDIKLPVSTQLVIDILKQTSISNLELGYPVSLVQNEGGDFVKLVFSNSSEYKKLITANSFRSDKIKQGTLVKLQAGEIYVFLSTIRKADMYYFERIFKTDSEDSLKKDIKSLFKTFNLFWDPVQNVFVLYNNLMSSRRIIECYDVIPEYSEKVYSVKEKYSASLNKEIPLHKIDYDENTSRIKINGQTNDFSFWDQYYNLISFDSSDFKKLFAFVDSLN